MSNLLLGPLHGVLTANPDLARRVGVGLEFGVERVALRQRERVRALAEACVSRCYGVVVALLWRRRATYDDFIRRRLRGRHAADGFDDRFRDLLSYRGVAASLR